MDSLRSRGVAFACVAGLCLAEAGPAPAERPAPRPTALRASSDAGGVVRLRWRAVGPAVRFAVYRRVVADAHGRRCAAAECARRRVGQVRGVRRAQRVIGYVWNDQHARPGFRYRYWVAPTAHFGPRTRLSRSAVVLVAGRTPAATPPGGHDSGAPSPPPPTASPDVPPPEPPPINAPPPPVLPAPGPRPSPPPAPATGAAADASAARFVAVGGADRDACRASRPCRSFGYAYQVARPGDVVAVAGGSYGIQTIPLVATRTGPPIVFRPAAGAGVSVAGLDVFGSHVEVRDLVTRGWHVKEGASDVTFRNVIVRGGIFITGAQHIRVLGGSVGPGDSVDSQIKAADNTGAPVPSDILIDGVEFHEWTRVEDPSAHVECLQIGAGVRITIRNSVFRECETHGLFVRSWGGTARIADIDIERNWFGATAAGYYALRVAVNPSGPVYQRIRVAYNTARQPLRIDPGAAKKVTMVGNTVSGGR